MCVLIQPSYGALELLKLLEGSTAHDTQYFSHPQYKDIHRNVVTKGKILH